VNLGHHVDLLLRHRRVVAAGLFLGLVLGILAIYQVPSMERRGSEQWSVESQFLVTQPGFPEGRVTLPNTVTDPAAPMPDSTGSSGVGSQTFADPGRLSSLAVLYSAIAVSDQVRRQLSMRVAPEQISANALDASGNGTNYLPIIRLVTTASSARGAAKLNAETFAALKDLLASRQGANNIDAKGRVRLNLLSAPSEPLLLSGPSTAPAVLAFLLCLLGTIALVHVRESLTLRRRRAGADEGFGDPFETEISMTKPGELTSIRTGRRRAG
jgi:hypothetical protein